MAGCQTPSTTLHYNKEDEGCQLFLTKSHYRIIWCGIHLRVKRNAYINAFCQLPKIRDSIDAAIKDSFAVLHNFVDSKIYGLEGQVNWNLGVK